MSPHTAAFGTTFSPVPFRFRNSPPRSGSLSSSSVQQTPTLSRRRVGLKVPFSPAPSLSTATQYSLSHPLSGPTRARLSRPSPLLLWLRVGDLRICDNPVLLHASRHGGPVLPVVSVSGRDLRRACVVAALRDLRRGLVRRGSELHVVAFDALGGDRAEREAVAQIVRQVRAEVVVLSGDGEGVLGGVRVVGVGGRDVVLCSGPTAMPGSGEAGRIVGEGVVRGVGVGGGEEEALRRLRKLLQEGWWRSGEKVVQGMVRRELWLGCVSRQRVAQEVRSARERWGTGAWRGSGGSSADGLVAGLCMSSAAVAYDVNGGDRRGIEWDADQGVFRLREWEHAETERRMNAAQRGSEFVRRRKMFLGRVFFPDDVTPDYYSFTAWRFAQRCVSATVGVFGTQALLLALGVKAGRIGQAAAISWVLKDGLGRVGKMLWAGSMGKDFDVDPKRWRFRSALLYACGNGMEIVTQIFPASFLVVATIANSMKQVSMLTSSATRNAMYRSFGGRAQNIANITAKGEAQIVVADLIGMACGIQLSQTIGTSKGNVLAAYTILTALDIFGIYMELRQVVFRTLNAERSSLVIEEYVKSGRILRPSDVSRRERIFLKPRYRSRSRFSSIIKAARTPEELDMLLHVFRNERFLVTMPPESAKRAGKRSGPCRVVLRNDARHEDVLRALLTVGYVLDRPRNGMRVAWLKSGQSSPESVLRAARRAANKAAPELSSELRKAGWNVDNLLFGTVKRGASWGTARIAPTSAP